MSPTRARAAVLDEICAQAVDLARAAALEMAGADGVGDHVGMQADGERVVTHLFACQDRAYVGLALGGHGDQGLQGEGRDCQ